MKNVIIMLWGMGLASAWWGIGLMIHDGIPLEDGGLGLAVGFTFVASLVTVVYILCKVISCIYTCWDD